MVRYILQLLMLKFKSGFIVVILFFLFSCGAEKTTDKNAFYREDMVLQYIANETEINDSEYLLALINATDCGACKLKDVQNIQKSFFYNKKIQSYYLFTKKKSDLTNDVANKKDKIIYTDVSVLEKYGLRLFTTYLFHIKKGEIIHWEKFE